MSRTPHLRLPGPARGLRIGLFGGSFNPAHEGHAHVAETALKRLELDWVWWLVARGNPLKTEHGVYQARLASARRMARHPRFRVSDVEDQIGVQYTADLIAALTARCPDTDFVWVMGADNLPGFHHWGGWERIVASLSIAVVARPDAGPRARLGKFAHRYAKQRLHERSAAALASSPPPAWLFLSGPFHTASSTALRARARARNPFRQRPTGTAD